METKKWYQSKIIIICAIAISAIVANHFTGFISANATAEQIQAVQAFDPAIAETLKDVKSGQNWFSSAGTLLFTAIAFIRIWFTKKQIA